MRQSFSKEEKLSRPSDIRRVLRSPQKCRGSGFSAHWHKSSANHERLRFGVLVSAKLIKSAPKRNRMKRLAREFFRLNKSKFLLSGDFIIRFYEYKPFKYKELEEILKPILIHQGLMK